MNTDSFDLKFFDDWDAAEAHGLGAAIWQWDDKGRSFPANVKSIIVYMPDAEGKGQGPIPINWNINSPHPTKWKLSGTVEKPTLHPSLYWIGHWHGWLREGRMKSC